MRTDSFQKNYAGTACGHVIAEHMVSLLVTTYNGERYLVKQLDSILAQSHSNLEIIVCDDCSVDGTRTIIEQYAARDDRVVAVLQERNVGLKKNLESGLRLARGEYIAISDQDDIWSTDKIEKLLACIGEKFAVFSDSELMDGEGFPYGKTLMQAMRIGDPVAASKPLALLKKNCVSGHSLLFRKEILQWVLPFDDRLEFDRQLAIASSLLGGMAFCPEPLVRHRIHADNQTNHRFAKYNPSSAGMAHKKSAAAKMARKQERYAEEFGKLCLAHKILSSMSDEQLARTAVPQVRTFAASLARLVCTMKEDRDCFFNIKLFLALLAFDKVNRHFGFKRIMRLCKGRRWHSLFDALSLR